MQISNTLSGHKEPFEPITLPVRMYVCGLTPKNEPHLGHARLFIANDVIRRYLAYRGYPVKYVQNFTDIDDKTIAAALRENIDGGRSGATLYGWLLPRHGRVGRVARRRIHLCHRIHAADHRLSSRD